MRLKRLIIIITAVAVAFVIAVAAAVFFGLRENKKLVITEYAVKNEKIPDSFNGYRIVQISDFHNPDDEEFVGRIINEVENSSPDIIVITGDLIDSRNVRIDIALDFVKQITDFAPVYFVTGNHEGRIRDYQRLENGLEELGVTVLNNECVLLEENGEKINLLGLKDPMFKEETGYNDKRLVSKWISEINMDRENYTVLIYHHPEFPEPFTENNIELVLTGHAHGGQIRLPLIGGLYSPGQGLFPEYDGGLYELDGTEMIVSRGLGNSAFPIRLNNPPEIVVVTLEK